MLELTWIFRWISILFLLLIQAKNLCEFSATNFFFRNLLSLSCIRVTIWHYGSPSLRVVERAEVFTEFRKPQFDLKKLSNFISILLIWEALIRSCCGVMVKSSDFHPVGPGSIPGTDVFQEFSKSPRFSKFCEKTWNQQLLFYNSWCGWERY